LEKYGGMRALRSIGETTKKEEERGPKRHNRPRHQGGAKVSSGKGKYGGKNPEGEETP